MSRLIDISKYEVLSFQDKSQDFVDGVQWILEQMDKEPPVKAIPLDRVEQIRAEIEKRDKSCYAYEFCADEILEIIDKVIKE